MGVETLVQGLSDLLGRRTSSFSAASLLKFSSLHPHVQQHLSRVYLTLTATLLCAAVGCYVGMALPSILGLAQVVAFGTVLGLAFTAPTPTNQGRRYGLLAAFGFTQGCALTPLVGMAAAVHPGVVLTAVLGTAAVFACFSASALLTPRRSYLFLGSFLAAATLGLLAMRLGSWLVGPSSFVWGLELYGGLLIFSGYVLFDTQVIIEKAYAGNMDHVAHAMDLFVDVIALFARILVILMQNASKKEEEADRRRRTKRS